MNFKLRSIHLFLILLAVLILCSLGMNLKEGLALGDRDQGTIRDKISGKISDAGDVIKDKISNRGNIGKKGFDIKKPYGYNDSGSYSNDPLARPGVSFNNRFGGTDGDGSDRTLSKNPKYDVDIDVKVSEDDSPGASVNSRPIRDGIADFIQNQSTSFTDPNSSFLKQYGYTPDTTYDSNSLPQPMTETSTDINDVTYTAGTTTPPPPGPAPPTPGLPPPGPPPPYPGLPGEEDQWILKSQIVPPVCPACPPKQVCDCGDKPAPPCPPCARCPEPAFKCAKIPNYDSTNDQYLPRPILADFSQFGM